MRILVALLCLCSLVIPSFVVFAQTDTSEFNVRVYAGTDTTPPTTPTLVSGDPISQTQIDLTWTASTDNFILSGYVLYRDGVPLATTTLTTYSDVGLTASTTYSYFVRAFDNAFNYSTSSNSLAVTTLQEPPPPAETEPVQSTVARVVANNITVTPGVSTSTFVINSAFPARFEIKWGRTASYELGKISSDILRRNYTTIITDLEPGTRYEYEIIGYTPYGASNVVGRGQFTTLEDPDLIAPANVSRFQAVPNGTDVFLSWRLPADFDIAQVRIVRSHLFYPDNPSDGAIVYQGTGIEAVDRGVLSQYSPAYYTAFVYDTSGNISSGAIAIAYADGLSSDTPDIPADLLGVDASSTPHSTSSIFVSDTLMPHLYDIYITQNGAEYTFDTTDIRLGKQAPFTIGIPSQAITKNLKSIIVTLQDPTDQRQYFSFLLRLNKNQSAYEAVIAPLTVEGTSIVNLSIYDYSSMRMAEYITQVQFVSDEEMLSLEEIKTVDAKLLWQFLVTIVLLALLLVWWLIAKRRKKDEDNLDADE